MKRRQALVIMATGLVSPALASAPRKKPPFATGIVLYALKYRRQWSKQKKESPNLDDPIRFLHYCQSLGAGGIQIPYGIRNAGYTKQFRTSKERAGMFFEAIINAPKSSNEIGRFEKYVLSAKEAGASVIRTVIMPGRRYEQFATLEEFRQAEKQAVNSITLMAPIVEKHKMRLAIENHKDHRVDERLKILNEFNSKYIGICFDVGNSFALLEDPVEVAKAFAPRTFTVHLKDQAVLENENGFLFADVALGEGIINLHTIVDEITKFNPDIHFSLELITRDPLQVPCLTKQYWKTMHHVSGQELARTMRVVKSHPQKNMQYISNIPIQKRVQIEHQNIVNSLEFSSKLF